MKKNLKKYDYYLYILLSMMIVILFIFVKKGITPFGDGSLLTSDFYHQYGPMLGEYYHRIRSGQNLIYSFTMGNGMPFLKNYFNYLASPFNLLLILLKKEQLISGYSIIIALKILGISISTGYYLEKKFGKNYLFIPLVVLYSFNAYITSYYWNIMWLDSIIMLPLLLLGIENIVKDKSPLLYIISLVITLYVNYYIAYMLCIFCVIYFVLYLLFNENQKSFRYLLKKSLHFGVYSLLSGAICAIFLLPLYKSLHTISALGDSFPDSQYYHFTLKDFIFNHLSGVGNVVYSTDVINAPNVSCGILMIFLLFIFLLNKEINLKNKLLYCLLILSLIIAFFVPQIDFIWSAFHVPNDLPYRYSFIYPLLITIISAYSISKIKLTNITQLLVCYLITMIIIGLSKTFDFTNIGNTMIHYNFISLSISFLFILIYKYSKKLKCCSIIGLIILAIFECCYVINKNLNVDPYYDELYNDTIISNISFIKENDKDIYRISNNDMVTYNDGSWFRYFSDSSFSSMEYHNVAYFHTMLGMPGNEINSYYHVSDNPVYDLIANVKYIINGDILDEKYYSQDGNDINKFDYNVGLIFGVNKEIKSWKLDSKNPFINLNDFIFKSTGIEDVFVENEPIQYQLVDKVDDVTIVRFEYKINDDIYLYNPRNSGADFVYLNNNMYAYEMDYYDYLYDNYFIDEYFDYEEPFIITETYSDDFELYVGYYSDDYNFKIYTLDYNKFIEAYNILNESKFKIKSFKENKITGSINMYEDQTVYTSIPYDQGWKVYVDGKKVKTFAVGRTMLGFDVNQGMHDIVLKYDIPYFKIGSIITVMSIIAPIIVMRKRKKLVKEVNYES